MSEQISKAILDAVKKAKGIQLNGHHLRLFFIYKGQRCRPTLTDLKLTKANVKFAENKLAAIKYEIAAGTFDYSHHFPNCPKAAIFSTGTKRQSVDQIAKRFIDIKKGQVDPNTIRSLNSYFENHVSPKWGSRLIDTITKSEIEQWRSVELSHLSAKFINNMFALMRGTFTLALTDGIIKTDPMILIKNLRLVYSEPDPFLIDELDQLAETNSEKESEKNYIQAVAWSGLRVEEALALAWEDLDLERGIAYINRAVASQIYKRPKTHHARSVELLDPVIEILKKQKAISYMLEPIEVEVLEADKRKKTAETIRPVFINSNNGGPFKDARSFASVFWDSFIRKAGVRHRGVNQLRHTYASRLITTGEISLEWIAQQMGTSVAMLRRHYGKIIEQERKRKGKEISKLLGVETKTKTKLRAVK